MAKPTLTVVAGFTDQVSGQDCGLVLDMDAGNCSGVRHPGCAVNADLVIEMDAFFCPACKMNGRVSGAWAADLIETARAAAGHAER